MREPCIMRWPGQIPAGKVCGELATTMDFLPTLAKLAGAEIPAKHVIDGKDIFDLMRGEAVAKSPYSAFYYYWLENLEAVRSGRWKLILPRKERFMWRFTGQPENRNMLVPVQLYDLKNDIGEKNNVAGQHPDIVKCLLFAAEQFDKELKSNQRPAGEI